MLDTQCAVGRWRGLAGVATPQCAQERGEGAFTLKYFLLIFFFLLTNLKATVFLHTQRDVFSDSYGGKPTFQKEVRLQRPSTPSSFKILCRVTFIKIIAALEYFKI